MFKTRKELAPNYIMDDVRLPDSDTITFAGQQTISAE